MDTADLMALGSIVVAILSLILSIALVRRQIKLQYESLKAQIEADVLAWTHEAVDALSDAAMFARGRGDVYEAAECRRGLAEAGNRLSALADRGRLFFPNESPKEYGVEMEGAFKGVRPPILDAMVFACCHVEHMDRAETPDVETADFLVRCRRLVVSEAQNAINPRRRRTVLDQLAEGREDDQVKPEQAVSELHGALAKRAPAARVVTEWSKSRDFLRKLSAPAQPPASPG